MSILHTRERKTFHASPHSRSMAGLARTLGIQLPLFLLLSLCYVWPIDLDPGANVFAHIDQAAAIVEEGTLSIDRFVKPPDGPNTVDWSRGRDGRFYPAKAPGLSFAALPVLAMLYRAESAMGIEPFKADWLRRNLVLVNWAMNSLVSALAMTLLLRLVLTLGVEPRHALLAVLSIALGTAYYPYATTYAAHSAAANFIVAAAYCVFVGTPSTRKDALAGLLVGCAVTCDYAAAFAVVVLAAVLWVRRTPALLPFALGGLLPLAFLVWYHTTVFGGPAVTAYRSMNPRISPPDGRLLRIPQTSTLITLLLSPYRGLFFYSPVLLLALVGAWRTLRSSQQSVKTSQPFAERDRRLIIWTGITLFALWFAFNACYYIWWGGWTAGSRYIVPGLVLLAPAVAVGFGVAPRIGVMLLAISIANQLAVSTVVVMVNDDILNPLRDVIYPSFWRGDFQRSNVSVFLFGLSGLWSLLPLALSASLAAFFLARQVARRT